MNVVLIGYRGTGKTELFDRPIRRYENRLYRYLCRYLDDAALAEDVFQQTFLQVHLKCDQFEEGRSVRPWVYAIATNQAVDAIRRRWPHYSVDESRCERVQMSNVAGYSSVPISV